MKIARGGAARSALAREDTARVYFDCGREGQQALKHRQGGVRLDRTPVAPGTKRC